MGIRKAHLPERLAIEELAALNTRHGHACQLSARIPRAPIGSVNVIELEPGLRLFIADVELPAHAPVENHYNQGLFCSLCLEGRMHCCLNGDPEPIVFQAGDLWFQEIKSGDVWVNEAQATGRFRSLCLQIDRTWMMGLQADVPYGTPLPATAALRKYASMAFSKDAETLPPQHLRLRALGMMMMAEALDAATKHPPILSPNVVRSRDLPLLAAARSLIEREYEQTWTMEQIADRVGLPVRRLKSGFRQAFGCTVFGHLQAVRMARAYDLLRQGKPVTSVALEVGYSHPGSFSRAYRAAYGHAPSNDGG